MTEYGRRTRPLPAPPHVVWADLVEPKQAGTRAWLTLLDDETPPVVLEAVEPSRVVWSSLWPRRPEDRIVLELARKGRPRSPSPFLAAGEPPEASLTGHLRKRVNHLLYADLRFTYGQ